MKPMRCAVLFLIVCTVVLIGGCPSGIQTKPDGNQTLSRKDIRDIQGVWKDPKSAWQVVITSDGQVDSAVIPLGEVEVRPNRTTEVEMLDGQISTYTASDFPLHYNPQTQELQITITIEKFNVVYLDNQLKGNIEYGLTGFLSEDKQSWPANLIEIFDFGPDLPWDPDVDKEPVLFQKVSDR